MPRIATLIGTPLSEGEILPRGRRAGVRGSVRETPPGSGRWQARWPRDIDIRQRPLTDLETGEALRWQTEAEARAELNKRLREIAAGRLVIQLDGAQEAATGPQPPTLESVVLTYLIEHEELAPSTRDGYRSALRAVICNEEYGIGQKTVTDLTTPMLRQWKVGLRGHGVSSSMETLAWKTLSAALSWEAEMGRWITDSPAKLPKARLTKARRGERDERIDRIVLPTWEQVHQMATAISDPSDRLMMLTMAWCGPRLSEAAAIEPSWLLPDTREIRLTHTWQRETGGSWEKGALKGGERRNVPVPRGLWTALVRLSKRLTEPSTGHKGVLFRPSYELGLSAIGVYNRWTWRDTVWVPMLAETGLDFTTKDLRAFAASLLADSGATHLELMKVLGHAQMTTTIRYYTRAIGISGQDPARLAIRATQRLTYQQRLDRLWAAWVKKYGDPTKTR